MSDRSARSGLIGYALLLAFTLPACVAPNASKLNGKPQREGNIRGGIAPQTIRPSASPAASKAPTGKTSPAPSPTPTLKPLSAESQRIREAVEQKLLKIAQIGFAQNRSNILSNNSGGVIANNGVGIISNASGGIVSNNGGGYRIGQANETIQLTPLADELLFSDRHWPDETQTRMYVRDMRDTDAYSRTLTILKGGQAVEQVVRVVAEKWPDGKLKKLEDARTKLSDQGEFRSHYAYDVTYDAADQMVACMLKPGVSKVREASAGVSVDIDAFSVDVGAGTGGFTYVYGQLGLKETGTLAGVKLTPSGQVLLVFSDPLAYYDGESRVETSAGQLLFTKRQQTVSGLKTRTYDMQGGLVAVLEKQAQRFVGVLNENGSEIAKLAQDTRDDGSVVFSLTFPDAPDTPLQIGYGVKDAVNAPETPPSPPAWRVVTLAGGTEAGHLDGTGAEARFKGLTGIVRSRKFPNRYYLADTEGQRIRALTFATDGKAVVSTYAGDGTNGAANGARLEASFSLPYGLAVSADDTLYVSEQTGHRIRKIAPDGTVTTFAGTGAPGYKNGAGSAAQFQVPTGLAFDGDGNLLVADNNNHAIRQITPDGVVSTWLGDRTAGLVNGPIAGARIALPLAVATDALGNVFIADRGNRVIRKVTPDGTVSTHAGSGEVLKAFRDGPGLEGGINPPIAMAVRDDGTVFVTHFDIRTVSPQGKLGTYAGGIIAGARNGTNQEALFGLMFGLAFADGGLLIVTDGTYVRAVLPPGTATTP